MRTAGLWIAGAGALYNLVFLVLGTGLAGNSQYEWGEADERCWWASLVGTLGFAALWIAIWRMR